MNKPIALLTLLLIGLMVSVGTTQSQTTSGKVLIVLSSTKVLTLKGGAKHPTGFYMNELGVPLKALVDAGFTPVFCNPKGNEPTMDAASNKPSYFGNEDEYKAVKNLLNTSSKLKHPQTLAKVADGDLNQFSAVFIPGGHAPMEDLWRDPALGKILRYFHEKKQPTALICHGPVALMSTSDAHDSIVENLEHKKSSQSNDNWTYAGYKMTVFSDAEEKSNEPGFLGGYMKFYPEDALRAAGGELSVAAPNQSNVVQDRELITGQNPYSDKKLASTLLEALKH